MKRAVIILKDGRICEQVIFGNPADTLVNYMRYGWYQPNETGLYEYIKPEMMESGMIREVTFNEQFG